MGHIKDRWYTGRGDTKKPTSRHGKGMRWQIWYTVDGREKCGGSFAVKAVAQKKLVELESSVIRGAWVDPTDQTTVLEYATRWAAARPHNVRTARRIDSLIRCHIDSTQLGSRRLAAVLPSDVQAWVTDRSQLLAPATLRKLVSLLSSVYTAAVLDRRVASSPVVGISLPSTHKERLIPLSVDQVRQLADATPERFRGLVYVQAGLGLRLGELLALRIQDVDFLRRTVRIEHQVAQDTLELIAPKTPRSRRTLPLPAMVGEVLAAQIKADPPGPDGLLWSTSTGRPIDHDYYGGRVFPKAVAKAKLPPSTPHDLRHHYASVLLAAGESVIAVAERLGHENANLVLSTYGHLMPDSEDRTRKAIDGAWSTVSGDPPTAQGRPQ